MSKKKFGEAISSVIGQIEEKQSLIENDVRIKMLNPAELLDFPKQEDMFGDMDGNEYESLKEGIEDLGVLEPIIVRKIEAGYQVLAGHRRKKICLELGIEVPARIMNLNDVDAELVFLTTNTKNRNLSDMQKAKAIRREKELIQEKIKAGELKGKATDYVAESQGMNTRTVERLDRLNRLIPELQDLVHKKEIATGKAQELALLDKDTQKLLFDLMKEKLEELKLEEIKEIRKQFDDEKSELLTQLQEYEVKLKAKHEEINLANKDYIELKEELHKNQNLSEEEIQALKDQIAETENKLESLNEEKEKLKKSENVRNELEKAKQRIEELEALEKTKKDIEKETQEKIEKAKEEIQMEMKKKLKEKEDELKKQAEDAYKEQIEEFKKQLEELQKGNKDNEYMEAANDELMIGIKSAKMIIDANLVQLDELIQSVEGEIKESCVKEFDSLLEALGNFKQLKEHFKK